MAVIALIEDLAEHSEPMAQALRSARHKVNVYADEASALNAVTTREFDVILLDIELGSSTNAGHTILDRIERKDRNRVLVLSQSPRVNMLRPMMLKMGAWDYIPKPLEPETLVLKVERLLQDALSRSPTTRQVHGKVSWDPNRSSEMSWNEDDISIPATACDLVKALVLADGAMLTYKHLMEELGTPSKENLRSHIRHAREAFKTVDPDFEAIRNVPRRGYAWNEN